MKQELCHQSIGINSELKMKLAIFFHKPTANENPIAITTTTNRNKAKFPN